jgi:hypothetical protein
MIKPLSLVLLLGCALLIPVVGVRAQAGEIPSASTPSYKGGLLPGTTFTLKIKDVMAVKIDSKGNKQKTSIPKGIPRFKKGQKVKFTIGLNEELQGPGFSFPLVKSYRDRGVSANDYEVKSGRPIPNGATIYKSSDGKVVEMGFGFVKWNLKSSSASAIVVAYQAE